MKLTVTEAGAQLARDRGGTVAIDFVPPIA